MNPFDLTISFEEKAFQVFEYQKEFNPVYGKFCKALGVSKVSSIKEIPLLPIQAFKDAELLSLKSEGQKPELVFRSSGTSGMSRSKHYVVKPELYRESILKGMHHFYSLDDFVTLAYTPRYNSNPESSLIWMLSELIRGDESGLSGFLELDKPLEQEQIQNIYVSGKRVMLFGAAFGLLDLVGFGDTKLPKDSIIIETGGMKTFRREISRTDLHAQLADGFGISNKNVHSEYGMTELLSQAYSRGNEWFQCVPWMSVSIRKPANPMEEMSKGEEGLIGVIDLANVYSCSFILTGDKGIQNEDRGFQVLGRWNPQNLRGCNFLIDQD
ncbi:MAG: hypothetical protein ED557_14205 [Balneola sp.]|nr:MAG: hypothetical protein ED557_14205 [Balneola sp.]